MLLPVGQSILARAAGPQRMGRVMSIIGVPMVLGPIMGPVIGGLIVSNYSWRWIFYINVPIGIVTLIVSQRWLPRRDGEERFATSFDTLGFCLLSPGLAALVYALSEVGTTGSYTGAPVLISFVLGLGLITAFILHAFHVKNPLLELHPFKHRNFAIANVCIFVIGATLYGSMFLLPLYYQVARGQEAWVAGLLLAPQGIGAACIMRWAGSVTDRLGPRRVVPFGILLMAVATVPFAFVTTSTSEVLLAVTLFVRGLGLGLSMMPVTAAAYFDLNHAEIPKASTVMNIMRLVGGSVATALFAVVLERQIVSNLGALAAKAGGSAGVIGSVGKLPAPLADPVAAAFAHTFWWSVGAILLAFIPTLFLPSHGAAPAPATTDGSSTEGELPGDDDAGPRLAGTMHD
jgi:EmrB/QacA subfamily drug resistance transporter